MKIQSTESDNETKIAFSRYFKQIVIHTGARGPELPPPFVTFCLHIYFQ
jgi:hypothetical protein